MNIEQVLFFVLPWTAQDDDYLLDYSYVIIYIIVYTQPALSCICTLIAKYTLYIYIIP